jgi:hypothetical protein
LLLLVELLLLLLAGLLSILEELLLLLIEGQLLLAWLKLLQLLLLTKLLSLLLVELLLLLLGLQLLPVLLLLLGLLLLLLSFSPPVFAVLSSELGGALAALCAHAQRITGNIDALVASARLKNQSGPGPCSNAFMVIQQEACGSQTKSGKWRGGSCTHVVCLSPLSHQAGGDLHIQLP